MSSVAIHGKTMFGEVREIARETANGPWEMLRRFSQGVKIDALRIRKASIPGAVLGLPLAAATLPLVALTVPSAIAARASAACDTPIGRTFAGIGGFIFGAALTGWVAEVAIVLHTGEVLCWTGRAYERVESKRAAALAKAGEAILRKAEEDAAAA